jgi:hypothetical protein
MCPDICVPTFAPRHLHPNICTSIFASRYLRSIIVHLTFAPRHLRTRFVKYFSKKVENFKNVKGRTNRVRKCRGVIISAHMSGAIIECKCRVRICRAQKSGAQMSNAQVSLLICEGAKVPHPVDRPLSTFLSKPLGISLSLLHP